MRFLEFLLKFLKEVFWSFFWNLKRQISNKIFLLSDLCWCELSALTIINTALVYYEEKYIKHQKRHLAPSKNIFHFWRWVFIFLLFWSIFIGIGDATNRSWRILVANIAILWNPSLFSLIHDEIFFTQSNDIFG